MKTTTRFVAAVAALVMGAALIDNPAGAQEKKGRCFLAGGEATMVTGDLARFMANAALNNSIKGANATAQGKATMTCKDGAATVYCLAQQRACR